MGGALKVPKGYKYAQAKSQKAQKIKFSNSLPMEGPAMSIATPGNLVQEDTEEGGVPMQLYSAGL